VNLGWVEDAAFMIAAQEAADGFVPLSSPVGSRSAPSACRPVISRSQSSLACGPCLASGKEEFLSGIELVYRPGWRRDGHLQGSRKCEMEHASRPSCITSSTCGIRTGSWRRMGKVLPLRTGELDGGVAVETWASDDAGESM
jgi:hypothetical protein